MKSMVFVLGIGLIAISAFASSKAIDSGYGGRVMIILGPLTLEMSGLPFNDEVIDSPSDWCPHDLDSSSYLARKDGERLVHMNNPPDG